MKRLPFFAFRTPHPPLHIHFFKIIFFRAETFGDMFDKAVDKILNNKDFMKFAKEKKKVKIEL